MPNSTPSIGHEFRIDGSYFCRLCWNTNQWKSPIKRERRVRGNDKARIPFIEEFGFGYEDWLNRPDWLVDGKRYDFVQPVLRSLRSKLRKTLHLVLHTRDPEGGVFVVGSIRGAQVLHQEQAESVLAAFHAKGWLPTMADEIKKTGGNYHQFLKKQDPREKVNVSFNPEDFRLVETPVLMPLGHRLYRQPRFLLYKTLEEDRIEALFTDLTLR